MALLVLLFHTDNDFGIQTLPIEFHIGSKQSIRKPWDVSLFFMGGKMFSRMDCFGRSASAVRIAAIKPYKNALFCFSGFLST